MLEYDVRIKYNKTVHFSNFKAKSMDKNIVQSWDQVRQAYPNQFVVFEALRSHSLDNKRIVDAINVLESFTDGSVAMKEYLKLHNLDRNKELYVVHTDKQNLDISERKWLGIRLA